YKLAATSNTDQPIEGKAQDFTAANYGFIVYMKTAACFNYLRAYLGNDLYDKCMREYFKAWKFKHPQPKDLRKIVEKNTKKDLSWFFDDLIGTNKVIDYKITTKRKPDTKSRVTYGWMKYEEGVGVKNVGGIAAPIFVAGYAYDTIADARWYQGLNGSTIASFPNGSFDRVVIDPFYDMPDINHSNNFYKYKIKGKKLFAKTEPLKLKFLLGYENPRRSTLFYTPVVGGNAYDGWQAGVAFYNSFAFQKPVEWAVMPLYGIRSGKINGSLSLCVNSNYRESTLLSKISYTLTGATYSYLPHIFGTNIDFTNRFFRISPGVKVDFKPSTPRSPYRQRLHVLFTQVGEMEKTTCEGDCEGLIANDTLKLSSFVDLEYSFSSSKVFIPWTATTHARYGPGFAFVTAEYKWSRVLGVRGKKVHARVYAGAFLFNNTTSSRYNLRGDGIRGYYDYEYAGVFIGRNETQGVWAQQFMEGFANIKTPTAYAQSNKWNVALNLSGDLPIPYFKVFADVAAAPYTTLSNGQTTTGVRAVYDAGFNLSLFWGALNIYVPCLVSKRIADEYSANSVEFYERIRFTLNLLPLAPNRLSKTIKLF
ncbi:MAG TPA: M1 family aminopeptidase, partial [Flavobacteriales bacterium]|nr:M1 family aminopeptidase [Flavobacteriales bacterium]